MSVRTLALLLLALAADAQAGGELRFCIRGPKTLHPLLAADDGSEAVRYLTAGVLVRVNRVTQQYQPELATSWKVSPDSRSIEFQLRAGVSFSDGTPFSVQDVAFTMEQALDPKLHSPVGDTLRPAAGSVAVSVTSPSSVRVSFPAPIADLARRFDTLPILSAKSPLKEKAVLGPFVVAAYQPGNEVLLQRNPRYWKHDAKGQRLPYLDTVRLLIQENRETEYVRFRRGEIQLINQVQPEIFDRLRKEAPAAARDSGPSTDVEFVWFNQANASPIPAYKKDWFRSRNFRLALSLAINRPDICRAVYRGHGQPALGPMSPANRFWFDQALAPQTFDVAAAIALLQKDGFVSQNGVLRDRKGNAVEFSVITNSGNRVRERTAAVIQQDWKALGIQLNIVTLDFPSLIERITQTYQYETCLLGLTNVDLDPDEQMNVWLSSGGNHGWNPNQKTPATEWEAEIDRLMRVQAGETNPIKRKSAFDKVQQRVREQVPFIYLVNRSSLSAVSPALRGAQPAALAPETYWNIEQLSLP